MTQRPEKGRIEAPLRLYGTGVKPEWVDYNGHMSEAFYALVFGYATDALLDAIGMDGAYRERTATSVYTLETHVTYLREVGEGEPLSVTTQLLDSDHKRLHVFHSMHHGGQGGLLATAEALLACVDTTVGRSAPFAPTVLARIKEIRERHAGLPAPEQAGSSIGIRRRNGSKSDDGEPRERVLLSETHATLPASSRSRVVRLSPSPASIRAHTVHPLNVLGQTLDSDTDVCY